LERRDDLYMSSFRYINISYKRSNSLTELLFVVHGGTFAVFDHGYMNPLPEVSGTKFYWVRLKTKAPLKIFIETTVVDPADLGMFYLF